jgi:hypothetical protein
VTDFDLDQLLTEEERDAYENGPGLGEILQWVFGQA